ncbi:MAG: hypothetical protein LBR31_08945 [Desulfovibrio sp.]|jgi:hypothetical protein|nr:hypothetical protein [Desulfovibrio sp.]
MRKTSETLLGVRLARLTLALAALLFVVYGLAPLLVEHFGPMREYAAVVRDTGIDPGALYYSDVAQTNEAEMSNRDAVRYFARSGVSPFVLGFVFLYFCILLRILVKPR